MRRAASVAVTKVAAKPNILPDASSSAEIDCNKVANPIFGIVAKKKKKNAPTKTIHKEG